MRLGTRGHYAVLAMTDLAKRADHAPISIAGIAQRQQIPLAYLEQIFVRLRQAGLIESVRGARGGYRLTRLPNDIRISEIVLSAGERFKTTACREDGILACMGREDRCAAHHLWAGLGRHILDYLKNRRLSDLVSERRSA